MIISTVLVVYFVDEIGPLVLFLSVLYIWKPCAVVWRGCTCVLARRKRFLAGSTASERRGAENRSVVGGGTRRGRTNTWWRAA